MNFWIGLKWLRIERNMGLCNHDDTCSGSLKAEHS
jgi:hypothetical protein